MDLPILMAMLVSHLAVAVIAVSLCRLHAARALRASDARRVELEDELQRNRAGLGDLNQQFKELERKLGHTQRRLQSIHDCLTP